MAKEKAAKAAKARRKLKKQKEDASAVAKKRKRDDEDADDESEEEEEEERKKSSKTGNKTGKQSGCGSSSARGRTLQNFEMPITGAWRSAHRSAKISPVMQVWKLTISPALIWTHLVWVPGRQRMPSNAG